MQDGEKIRLLRSLKLLEHLTPQQLESLTGVLRLVLKEDGAVVFEEGSPGESLFFVTSGEVRIRKRSQDGTFTDLAILGPGDCFGEMALMSDGVARSAGAVVSKSCVLFELGRRELKDWLSAQPGLAVEFFNGLVQLQSARLRRTSKEATLLFDLSRTLLGRPELSKELLAVVLDELMWYLEGPWWAGAMLLNGGSSLVAERGSKPPQAGKKAPSYEPSPERRTGWSDAYTFQAFVPEGPQSAACLMLRSRDVVSPAQRHEMERCLEKAARLLSLVAAK